MSDVEKPDLAMRIFCLLWREHAAQTKQSFEAAAGNLSLKRAAHTPRRLEGWVMVAMAANVYEATHPLTGEDIGTLSYADLDGLDWRALWRELTS